jgi:hypothetical protein
MLNITAVGGAIAGTALLCAIGLPAGSFVANAALATCVMGASVALVGFVSEKVGELKSRRLNRTDGRYAGRSLEELLDERPPIVVLVAPPHFV